LAAAALGCFTDVEQTSESDGSGTSSTTFTTLSTGSTTSETTGAPECVLDGGCAAGFVCVEGECQLDPENCGEVAITVPVQAANMVLVLDKSGSMVANTWDHDGDPVTPPITRWRSLHGVVEQVVSSYNGSLNLGAVLFPGLMATKAYDEGACWMSDAVDVPVADQNGEAVLVALPSPNSTEMTLAGGTPATRGIELAFGHLSTLSDGLPQYIVLVTDGAANCRADAVNNHDLFETYDPHLLPLVEAALAAAVPTFVVGIDIRDELSPELTDGSPNSVNTYQELNALAVAGGRPKDDPSERFYNANDQTQLSAALTEIAGAVVSCVISLAPAPTFPSFVELNVGGVNFGKATVNDCATEDGWRYVDEMFTTVELCGQACSLFKQSGSLNASYKCPPSG
jgi:hypothetical protein